MVELTIDNVAKISLDKTSEVGQAHYWAFSNSLEGASLVLQYIAQNGTTKAETVRIAEEWVRSNFSEFDGDLIAAVIEKLSASTFQISPYALMAELAIQSAYQENFQPFESFMGDNISEQAKQGFLKEFCNKFIAPIPSNVNEHIQAKQQIISNYGQMILETIHGNGIDEKNILSCEALLAFSKWYPVDWYPEYQEEIQNLLDSKNPLIVPFPFLIYASVIQRNRELFDPDSFQALITFQQDEAEDTQYLQRKSAITKAQSELFRAAGDILIEIDANEYGEILCEIVESYFFDLENTISTLYAEDITVNIISTLLYLFKVAPQFAERLCRIAILRWRGLFHPARPEPVLCRTDAVKEVEMLFISAYESSAAVKNNVRNAINEEYLNELDDEGSMICALAQAAIIKLKFSGGNHNWESEFVLTVFESISGLLETEVSEFTSMDNTYFPQLYLVSKFASLNNEFAPYAFSICFAALLVENYSKNGVPSENTNDYTNADTLQKVEFQDLLIEFCSDVENIDADYVTTLLTSGSKGNVKVAAALFAQVNAEQRQDVALQAAGYIQEQITDVDQKTIINSVMNFFPFFSNIGLAEEEIISPIFDIINSVAEYTTANDAVNAAWMNAFKCCAAKALIDHFGELAERSSIGLSSTKAFSDLILNALKAGRSARDHSVANEYQSASMEYGVRFISEEFLGAIIENIYGFIVSTFQNTRHIPTSGETYRRLLGPLMRTMFEILENASGTIREANIEEPMPPYQFIAEAIAERCNSPEAYESVRAVYNILAANRGELQPEQLAYCSAIYWNFFYSPDFNPNRQSWQRVIQLMVADMAKDAYTLRALKLAPEEKDEEGVNLCYHEYLNQMHEQESAKFIINHTGDFFQEFIDQLQKHVTMKVEFPIKYVVRTFAQLGNTRKAYGFEE